MAVKESSISNPSVSFREANEGLVNSIQGILERDKLSQEDKTWLAGELDVLIENLKNVKAKLAVKVAKKKAA